MKNYYYLTKQEDIDEILTNGIRSNSDEGIFLFDNVLISFIGTARNKVGEICKGVIKLTIAELIANLQGLTSYALFEISGDGIFNEPVNSSGIDIVADRYTYKVQQSFIAREHLRVAKVETVKPYAEFVEGTVIKLKSSIAEARNSEMKVTYFGTIYES